MTSEQKIKEQEQELWDALAPSVEDQKSHSAIAKILKKQGSVRRRLEKARDLPTIAPAPFADENPEVVNYLENYDGNSMLCMLIKRR